ncbi:MAG: sigma-54-dependent Fis family transcriptional regulator [Acidobacteria bacterium]|nr:sigma-54-dependent Fis family transcriptional regulator [Acidobacteriota bacterium]
MTSEDPTPLHLLLVEDEAAYREVVAERLTEQGYRVAQAGTGEEALERLNGFAFDILLTDLRLPGVDGRQVLDEAFARYPDIIAVVITGFGTVREAVEVTRLGAEGFITKPFQFEELVHVLQTAVEKRRLRAENAYLREQLRGRFHLGGIIGQTPPILKLIELLETVAATSSTVLVTGETGTGKELAARAIHDASPRRMQRFVAINCSAIPETLLEAELFGHVRGAFTGAIANRQGRVEQAHRGTLFLDEVGTMSPGLQVKLLRVLQSREFERVGDSQTIKVDVRVIAATNSDLKLRVADGTFREDLFYRLNVIPVHVPALRERRADIPVLAQHFLDRLSRDTPARGRVSIAQDAQQALMAFAWPGNVRQLENVMERAFALSPGRAQIEIDDLPDELRSKPAVTSADVVAIGDEGIEFDRLVGDFERELIRRALEKAGGNKRMASDLLHIKRTTLIEKLKRLERN